MRKINSNKTFEINVGEDNSPVTFGNVVAEGRYEADAKIRNWNEDDLCFAYEGLNSEDAEIKKVNLRKDITIVNDKLVMPSEVEQVDALAIESENESVYLYKIDEDNFEFEVHLSKQPEKLQWDFTVTNWQNFKFFPQLPLTKAEIEEGCSRPINVEHSIAVYHNAKKNNKYKTGKACHIYRPYALDAENNLLWGKLKYTEGKLSVYFEDEAWFKKAIYPIIIDPTFGQTSKGASCHAEYNSIASKFTLPQDGTVDSIHAAHGRDSGAGTVAGAVWDDDGSGGIPLTLLVSTTAASPPVSGGSCSFYGFSTYTAADEALTAGDFWIGIQNSAFGLGWDVSYDSGDVGQGRSDSDNLPLGNWTTGSSVDRAYSVYVTYTLSNTAPDQVTGLSATKDSINGHDEIDLAWTEPGDGGSAITGYKIERKVGAGSWATLVADTGTTDVTYSDTGLTVSTLYTYRVSAINGVGTGTASDEASDTTDALAAPNAPTGLGATATGYDIALSWTAPTDDGGSSITGYFIERKVGTGAWATLVADTGTTTTSYSDTGLDGGTLYTYRVSAINAVDTGTASSEANDTTDASTAPSQVTGLTASAVSDSQINLAWTAPASNGAAITGYKIERKVESDSWETLVADTGTTTLSYSDTSLFGDTLYTYRVSAINSVGTGTVSSEASDTTVASSFTNVEINFIDVTDTNSISIDAEDTNPINISMEDTNPIDINVS